MEKVKLCQCVDREQKKEGKKDDVRKRKGTDEKTTAQWEFFFVS